MKKPKNSEIISSQMREIIKILRQWDHEYYVLNSPTVNDAVYDAKLNELKKLEFEYDLILPDSLTVKMNTEIYSKSDFKLVKRERPMLSIDNVNNLTDLAKFDAKIQKDLGRVAIDYLCELKIDGLSASLIYQDNKLVQITTRGDGYIGEDVTFNKDIITNLPPVAQEAAHQANFEVRGEIYMCKSDFLQINDELLKSGLKALSNARNGAAGTLRTLIPNKGRKLSFLAYQLLLPGLNSQQECLDALQQKGFAVSAHRLCHGLTEVVSYLAEIESARDQIEFAIDGVVIKLNSYEDHQKLGETNKFPRWSVAYKFTSQTALTKIEKIVTEVSKNGRISYVAMVTPVQLDGSQISRVTLHNFAFIEKKLINIGDQILIKKAGDIIPQVAEVLKQTTGSWIAPENCVSCSSVLIWNDNRLYQLCQNKDCFERNVNYLTFFASKGAMNIKGVSKAIIEKLYRAKLVTRTADFYSLADKQSQLLALEGFKAKTVTNILSAIAKSRYQEMAKVIAAFSIPLLSSVKARKFVSLFNNDYHKLLAFIKTGDFGLIQEELGEKTAAELKSFFSDQDNLDSFERTLRCMSKESAS